MAEADYIQLKKIHPGLKVSKCKIRFTPYGTAYRLPVIGSTRVTMVNNKGKRIKTTVHIIRGQKESLLGREDGERLGIIKIRPDGNKDEDIKIGRITPVKKEAPRESGIVSGGETQEQIDRKMQQLLEEYGDLFKGIGNAKIEPIHIYTKKGRTPVAQKQRPIARHYLEPLRKHLDELLAADVIEGPLGSEHANGWVSNIVITAKGWDKSRIRMNLDTRLMADNVRQAHFPIPTSEQLRHEFQGSDRFTSLDLNHAFHQLPIDDESRKLFVFTTPFGLYRYKRLVMGTPPASSECHEKLRALFQGLKGVVQIKDDLVVHGRGQEHDDNVRQVFERMRKVGLTLRKEKCKMGKQEVVWFGNVYNRQGMSPDPQKVKTIKEWTAPKDKSEVKSFLQTCQFCSKYMRGTNGQTYSDMTQPLRELTKQNVQFKWTKDCDRAFRQLKEALVADTVLLAYDTTRQTRLYVDHGPGGIASTVAQKYEEIGQIEPEWRTVMHNSRALTKAEQGYGKMEGESLAILSGIKVNKEYLYGTKFEVVTDHKPLLAAYNTPNRPAPVRVERHISKLRGFRFKVVYEPGCTSPADYGSRHPPKPREYTEEEKAEWGIEEENEDEECTVSRLMGDEGCQAVTLDMVREWTQKEEELSKLTHELQTGKISTETKKGRFASVLGEMMTKNGLLFKGTQIVIPGPLQQAVIEAAHEGHMKEEKTIATLREHVWFPRLAKMTREFIRACGPCAASDSRTPPAPLKSRVMPDKPWSIVACDFKGPIGGPRGYYFHVTIDTYSRYPEVQVLKSTGFDKLRRALDVVWATHGIPDII